MPLKVWNWNSGPPPLIVQATLGFSTAILDAAALGFLGLGAQPPTPEWGSMLASALEFIQSAWLQSPKFGGLDSERKERS